MYKRGSQGWLKHLDFIILDEVVLQIAYIIAYIIRHGWGLPYTSRSYLRLAIAFFIVDFIISTVLNTMHNVMSRGFFREFTQTLKQALSVLAGMAVFMFSLQWGDNYSRIMVFLTAGFHFLLGYLFRLLYKPIVVAVGKGYKQKKSMILVADEARIPEIISKHSSADRFLYTGLVLTDRNATGEEICGIRVVSDVKNAADYICREWVDEVMIFPSEMSDISIQRTEISEAVEGFIDDSFKSFVKRDYQKGTQQEIQGSDLGVFIEQCRQMSIPLHINLPISNIGGKSFIECELC